MKKLIAIACILIVGAFVWSAAQAADPISHDVSVSLSVNDVFSFDIFDKSDYDKALTFGLVDEGSGAMGELVAYCGTNQNKDWEVTLQDDTGLTGPGTFTVYDDPVVGETFSYWSNQGQDTSGNWSAGTIYAATLLTPGVSHPVYGAADPSEHNDTDVVFDIGVAVNVPYGTTAGSYSTNLTFTMTELP